MARRAATRWRTVTGRTDHVVVVGAGLSGLAAALHLLGSGRLVTIVERAAHPGGRAGRLDVGGYRIDTGPTVLTMPDLLDDALHAVGESAHDRLRLTALAPAYRARFADGSTVDLHSDPSAMEAEILRVAGSADALGYRRLRTWLTRLYRAEFDTFIDANFDSPLDLLGRDLARLAGLGGFGRLGPAIGRFLRDDRLRRLFTFQALYAGVSPRTALALYAVISYMDTVGGVYFPDGGMRAVPQALADAAARAGAEFRYGQTVSRLERRGSRVTAVHTADGRIACDAVVLTPDLPVAYRLLGRTPRRPLPLHWSPSAVVLHLSTPAAAESGRCAHHTISFGREWDHTFGEIIRHGRLMTDPSLLLSNPTVSDPTLAPPGRELHYLLAPCPNLRVGRVDWSRVGPAYRDELLQVLAARGMSRFATSATVERLVTPLDWAEEGHGAGTPFALAHTFTQSGPFRPGNLPSGVHNAVLAGSGTTPGVGVPSALISGKLAAARICGPLDNAR